MITQDQYNQVHEREFAEAEREEIDYTICAGLECSGLADQIKLGGLKYSFSQSSDNLFKIAKANQRLSDKKTHVLRKLSRTVDSIANRSQTANEVYMAMDEYQTGSHPEHEKIIVIAGNLIERINAELASRSAE